MGDRAHAPQSFLYVQVHSSLEQSHVAVEDLVIPLEDKPADWSRMGTGARALAQQVTRAWLVDGARWLPGCCSLYAAIGNRDEVSSQ